MCSGGRATCIVRDYIGSFVCTGSPACDCGCLVHDYGRVRIFPLGRVMRDDVASYGKCFMCVACGRFYDSCVFDCAGSFKCDDVGGFMCDFIGYFRAGR